MFSGLEHIGLMANDPDQLARWYEKVLHFRRVFQSDATPPIVFLAGEQTGMIEFVPYHKDMSAPEKDKRFHLAIAVSDFDAAVQELTTQGVVFPDPVMHLFKGGKTLFFQDPEGNWVQIVYRPESPWKL